MAFKLLVCISFLILATLAQAGGYYKPRFIRSGLGGRCGRRKYVCGRGLTCIRGRCYKIVGQGRRCNVRRFIICSRGLRCKGGRCVKPLLPVGSPCSRTSECQSGLTCQANPLGKKICTDTRTEGETCDANKGLKCGRGLVCKNGKCQKVLRKVGESCTVTANCESGLTCEANPMGMKICTDTRTVGETCDASKGLKCGRGLVCKGGRCQKILRKVGETCSVTSDCESGLSCQANPMGKKICTDTRTEGETCDADKGLKCGRGLVCKNGKCRKILRKVGETCSVTSDCESGLSCQANPMGKKICTDTRTEGETCDANKGLKCGRGLVCKGGRCRRPLSGLGGRCTTSRDCRRGLTCLGRRGRGRCFDIQGAGQSCGRPFVICASGLKCDPRKRVCRRFKKKKYYY